LWVCDGTPDGTHLVRDLVPGAGQPLLQTLTDVNGTLYFVQQTFGDNAAGDNASKVLWRTDGTEAGTTPVRTFFSPYPSSRPIAMANVGGTLFVSAATDYYHRQLWTSDGTADGTTPVAPPFADPVLPSGNDASPAALTPFGASRVAFRGPDGEPWASDGTAQGTARVCDINTTTPGSAPQVPPVTLSDGRVVFVSKLPGAFYGTDTLWVTDGTPAGTVPYGDLAARFAGKDFTIDCMAAYGGAIYALAEEPGTISATHGMALWRIDERPGGTGPVAQLIYGFDASRARRDRQYNLVESAGVLYFMAMRDERDPDGLQLFRSDGTAAGTFRLKVVAPRPGGIPISRVQELTDLNGRLFLSCDDGFLGDSANRSYDGLWTSDGTEAGTAQLLQGEAYNLTPFKGLLYFERYGANSTTELWRSDGTVAGTAKVKLIGSALLPPVVAGDRLVFAAGDASTGTEPWASDGTPEGTGPLGDINPGAGSSISTTPFVAAPDGTAYFQATNPAAGAELWRTDGTPAGTALVADLTPGPANSSALPVAVVNGRVYFTATDPSPAGPVSRLWSSDGTSAGTRRVSDLAVGNLPYCTPLVGPDGDGGAPTARLLFWNHDLAHGTEPWITDAPAGVVGRHVFYNNSVYDGRDPAANAGDDAAVAPDKRALRAGGATSFANVSSYTRGINGLMIDVAGLPAGGELSADDFAFRAGRSADTAAWADAPAPTSIAVRRGAGAGGGDRVTLTWPDGAIRNAWLQVTLKATANTGLPGDDVFYFGSLVGDAGGSGAPRVDV
jgi:ELWxxDGT repeat protein